MNKAKSKHEEILDFYAKKEMAKWNLDRFRRTHPRFLRAILKAMAAAENKR